MKKTISMISMYALLTGTLLFVGMHESQAQQTAQGTTNPYVSIAAKFGVTAHTLGKFERSHTINLLEQKVVAMKPMMAQGGGTDVDKFRYHYFVAILSDVRTHYISTEISMLTRLASVDNTSKVTGLQNWQMASVYIGLAQDLQ